MYLETLMIPTRPVVKAAINLRLLAQFKQDHEQALKGI